MNRYDSLIEEGGVEVGGRESFYAEVFSLNYERCSWHLVPFMNTGLTV